MLLRRRNRHTGLRRCSSGGATKAMRCGRIAAAAICRGRIAAAVRLQFATSTTAVLNGLGTCHSGPIGCRQGPYPVERAHGRWRRHRHRCRHRSLLLLLPLDLRPGRDRQLLRVPLYLLALEPIILLDPLHRPPDRLRCRLLLGNLLLLNNLLLLLLLLLLLNNLLLLITRHPLSYIYSYALPPLHGPLPLLGLLGPPPFLPPLPIALPLLLPPPLGPALRSQLLGGPERRGGAGQIRRPGRCGAGPLFIDCVCLL